MIAVDESLGSAHSLHVAGNCADPFMVGNMTAEYFRVYLARIGLSQRAFAHITGANPRTVLRWAHGEQDIPPWVDLVLRLIWLSCPVKDGETPDRYAARLQFFIAAGRQT